jgi:hypothetical protein
MKHGVESTKQGEHKSSAQTRASHASAGEKSVDRLGASTQCLHPVLQLQQQGGNQAVQELLRTGVIQAKMAISHPDDPEEREADIVADHIMRSHSGFPASASCSCSAGGEMCEECQHNQATIHRRASSPASPAHIPGIVGDALRSTGHPLDRSTRAFFEPRFGRDFSEVRIHTDTTAARSARALSAHAYTVGRDIYFAAGKYAPSSALMAHELAHVLQQRSGKAPSGGIDSGPSGRLEQDADRSAQSVMSGSAPATGQASPQLAIQRDDDPDAGQDTNDDTPQPFDPLQELDDTITNLDKFMSANTKLLAQYLRVELLLRTATPDWPNYDAFAKFYGECDKTSQDEDQTIAALGADLNNPDDAPPEAFPKYWSKKLKDAFDLHYPMYLVQRDVDSALAALDEAGRTVPPVLFDHGLPSIGYENSLNLESFQFVSVVGVTFGWSVNPGGFVDPGSGPLYTFAVLALKYLRTLNDLDFLTLWSENAKTLVQQVEDGELSVNPAAFLDYTTKKRPQGIPFDSLQAESGGIPQPLDNCPLINVWRCRIDPFVAEVYLSQITGLVTFGRSFLHGQDVAAQGEQLIGQANAQVAAENPFARVQRSRRWGHEQSFYSDALLQQVRDIWKNKEEIAKSIAKDALFYTALEFIPVVNVITDLYLGLSLLMDAVDSLSELAAADEEAQDAKTVAQLQKAAADQAKAISDTARKAAQAIAMHYASKAAKAVATKAQGKVQGWTIGDDTAATPDKPAVPDDPMQAKRQAQDAARKTKDAADKAQAGDPRDRLPGEISENLENAKGDARVTAEGRCKICHSPCQFEVDMAREIRQHAAGTPYEGYAENLATRTRLLDEAMESSVRDKATREEMRVRFGGAFHNLSAEVDSAYSRIVDGKNDVRNAALDEIDGFHQDEHGMMDDPRPRWDPEKAQAGTSYHDRIKARILAELPSDTVFTEDTIQDYLRRQGVDAKYIPKPSTGIDIYILDNSRNLFVPVDITSVSGGRGHVRKLHTDVSKFREGVELVGMHVSDPIEIEYIGKTFDQAAVHIIAELRAYARPPTKP